MASFRGGVGGELVLNLYYKGYFGTFRNGLNTGVATFQGSRLEGVCCITACVSLHPQFKQIAQAYETLADEKKRKIYDEGGEEALKEGGSGRGHDARDIFDMFFGGGRGRGNSRESRTKNMVHPLKVSVCRMEGNFKG